MKPYGKRFFSLCQKILAPTARQSFFIDLSLINIGYFFLLWSGYSMDEEKPLLLAFGTGAYFVTNYLIALCCSTLKPIYRRILLGISILLAILDTLSYYVLHQPFYVEYLGIIGETNGRETSEFLATHVSLSASGMFLFFFTILILLPSFRHAIYAGWQSMLKRAPRFIAVMAAVFLLLDFGCIATNNLGRDNLSTNNVFRLGLQMKFLPEWIGHKDKIIPEVASYEEIPYVVLVIGESSSKLHYSLYGYSLPTTPYQDEEAEKGNLLVFPNAEAPEHFTTGAMPYLLSLKTREHADVPFTSFPTLYDILNNTCYETVWLSNQENFSALGSRERLFAHQCNRSFFTHDSSQSGWVPFYDESLLPFLDGVIENGDPTKPQFYTLHLMGNHSDYAMRYPPDFPVFSPDQEEGETEEIRQIRSQYDTSIRYTDQNLKAIYDRFRDKEAVVVYLSDHGEDCFDYDKKYWQGHRPHGSEEELWIPLTVWGSDTFIERHPDLWQELQGKTEEPINTERLPELLFTILSLTFS